MKINTKIITCSKEVIPSTRTRKGFLKQFLELRPATFNIDGTEDCSARRNRSISDLTSLVRSRFLVTSEKAVIRILAQLNQEGRCFLVWCTQINKFVVKGGYTDNGTSNNFITNYSTKYFSKSTGVDGFSYDELMEIRRKELKL